MTLPAITSSPLAAVPEKGPAVPAPHEPRGATVTLSGWGANLRAACFLSEPETAEQLPKLLDPAGTVARGLGRSYGDAALNEGGQVVGMKRLDRYLSFDAQTGVLSCEAGVSLDQIIRDFAPRGWFPAITPGTKFVTIGGCIANDVHGKAHHAQGSFATCVESFRVLLPSGQVVTASRDENAELFWATFGGMGMLGFVLAATLRLRKIETTYFRQKKIPVRDLEQMFAVLDENDQLVPYSVATLDVFATGKHLGRGVVATGDHAGRDELPASFAKEPLRVGGKPLVDVPFDLPNFALNAVTMRVLNVAIQQVQKGGGAFGHYEGFFYPLDILDHWNRGYGRRGFTQYQFVIPFEDGLRHMRAMLEVILSSGELPFLNVLKRMGKASGGWLSFPREGYTLAIDFPVTSGTAGLFKRLDQMVLDAGGRVYLGKDAFLDAATFRAMYPDVDRFLELKTKLDPTGMLTSNLARRVGLVAPR